ncbi:MAG: acyl-CoA thioesterase [Halobacteria archaeon]
MTSLSDSYVENTEVVNVNDSNVYNNAHGGKVVKWMDEAGVISAIRFAGEPCVTASMENVAFINPIHVGEAANIESYVFRTGTTSMKVRLRVWGEDLKERDRRLSNESFFTYVAIDQSGNPTEIPDLDIEGQEEERMRKEAEESYADAVGEKQK